MTRSLLLLLAACGLPTPYPPQSLAHDSVRIPDKALVHYLRQPEPIDARVCDLSARGPHVARIDDAVLAALMAALNDGTLPPMRWRACISEMWPSLPTEQRDTLLGSVLDAFVDRLVAGSYTADDRQTLDVLAAALRERPRYSFPKQPMQQASERLAQADLPSSSRFVRLFREMEIEANLYHGEPVTPELIALQDDVELLGKLEQGLSDEHLREAARSRWLRLRTEQSPLAVVQRHVDEAADSFSKLGFWPLPESEWQFTEVRWDRGTPAALAALQVAWRPDGSNPDLTIRRQDDSTVTPPADVFFDASFVLADGDVPLRACPYVLSMKVEPCVPAAAFQTSAPHAGFDERARLTLTQDLDAETLTALAATYDARIAWQVGNLNSAFDLPLFFDAPDDFVLQAEPGERGPDLRIVVSQEPHDRVRFDLEGPMGHRFLVVEQKALADLKVGSRGGVGTPGERGAAGAEGRNGVNGRNAVCPSLIGSAGGPGEPGGQGEPGGPGGVGADGGTVTVEVACACPDLRAALGEVIVAEGGPGGSGGAGGQGGPGGRGGQGGAEATCRDVLVDGTASFVAGGFDGPNGMRGEAGLSGATGPSGAPGTVTFVP